MTKKLVSNKNFDNYNRYLIDRHRPPSRGGNTKSLHSHTLIIEGQRYSFLAFGSRQWAYKYDTVSFEYEVKDGHKNILKETFVATSKSGETIVRGDRGS